MTKEEAIDELSVLYERCIKARQFPNKFYCSLTDGQYIGALDMAIKALEQEPCNDAISRQAVIGWLIDKDIIKTKNQEENARRELADLPPVIPQPKVGEWTKTYEPNDAEPFILWKCECCGLSERIKTHYCPNCGAKMEEVAE